MYILMSIHTKYNLQLVRKEQNYSNMDNANVGVVDSIRGKCTIDRDGYWYILVL